VLKKITWRPHRHRTATLTRGVVDLNGVGETRDIQMCACTAWRQAGRRHWHGSRFRRQLAVR
jgi:hypothetical protein